MKRILRALFLIGPCIFLFTKDVSAQELVEYNVRAWINGTHVYEDDKYDDLTQFNNYKLVAINNEMFYKVTIEDYSNTAANYLVTVTYCSTNYPTVANAVTPATSDLSNVTLIKNYSKSNPINSCSVAGYTGSTYQTVLALSKPNNVYTFSFTVWSGVRQDYGVYTQISNVSVIEFTEEIKNQYENAQKQDTIINQNDILNNSINNMNNQVTNALNTVKDATNETNKKLDELNNNISSENDDTTSKSCGLLCKLKGIFTGIIELPSKLVNLLIDALKSLFIPTDEQLYNIINKAQDLTENFGFVGESMNFFITIFTSLLGLVNANGCIELPEFTIGATSLFDAHTFWNAQQVCLNDNPILSNNIDTIRTITSIALVCLFINFAASKFFSILSKNDNEITSGMAASTRGEV